MLNTEGIVGLVGNVFQGEADNKLYIKTLSGIME